MEQTKYKEKKKLCLYKCGDQGPLQINIILSKWCSYSHRSSSCIWQVPIVPAYCKKLGTVKEVLPLVLASVSSSFFQEMANRSGFQYNLYWLSEGNLVKQWLTSLGKDVLPPTCCQQWQIQVIQSQWRVTVFSLSCHVCIRCPCPNTA